MQPSLFPGIIDWTLHSRYRAFSISWVPWRKVRDGLLIELLYATRIARWNKESEK